MKVRIEHDESYPVFFVVDESYNFGKDVEMTPEELAWITATDIEYHKVQDFMAAKVGWR